MKEALYQNYTIIVIYVFYIKRHATQKAQKSILEHKSEEQYLQLLRNFLNIVDNIAYYVRSMSCQTITSILVICNNDVKNE